MTRFVVLDAKVEGIFSHPYDPDWDDLRRRAGEYFSDCDSVGVVQLYPRSNGGRFELTAMKILREELSIPVTISYEISNEVDVLKTCAGTLLNAKLIPLISEFMTAIGHVCQARGLNVPISILLSNGTMVPVEAARQFPVETILCGPAASVVGGNALAGEASAVVVDMGGTTTDIAVVRNGVPTPAAGGIRIGRWKTMVQGISVDTIALGGDSGVRCRDHELLLDTVRVIPLSVLASQYGNVLPALTSLCGTKEMFSSLDYEFLVLVKDIAGIPGYTPEEQRLCAALREKPLTVTELANRLGTYAFFLPTKRLEADGAILRSGLTPTDMMILKGDFTLYEGAAARIAAGFLAQNVGCDPEELPDAVYELVVRRMYEALGGLILRRQFPGIKEFEDPAVLAPLLRAAYEQAAARRGDPAGSAPAEGDLRLSAKLPLVGVGAPIHIFLPRVAELLDTRAVIPAHADVANALGAVVSRRMADARLTIQAVYEGQSLAGFALPDGGERHFFRKYDAALAYGKEAILRTIRQKARLRGITGDPNIELSVRDSRIGHRDDGLILAIELSATEA